MLIPAERFEACKDAFRVYCRVSFLFLGMWMSFTLVLGRLWRLQVPMIQAVNGLQPGSRRNFPAWETLLPGVLEVSFPPLKQLLGAAGQSLASASSS